MLRVVAILGRNKLKVLLSGLLTVAVLMVLFIWSANRCNFSSLTSLKKSLDLFGVGPYGYCVTYAIPDSVHPGRLVDFLSLKLRRGSTSIPVASNGDLSRSGEEIYLEVCISCHGEGLSNAPVFGDTSIWNDKFRSGIEPLLRRTKDGVGGMPPMGLCASCTDQELFNAVQFLAGRSKPTPKQSNVGRDGRPAPFAVGSPTTLKGQAIEYPVPAKRSTSSESWNRSHANDANSKFFSSISDSDDKATNLVLKWQYDFFDIGNNEKFYLGNIELNPIVYDGSIIALGPDFRLVSINAKDGSLNWELVLPPAPGAIPQRGIVATEGKIFLNVGPRLVALDSQTGEVSSSFGDKGVHSGPSRVAPFIFGSSVYVLSIDGFLRGFDVESGEEISVIPYRDERYPGYAAIPWSGVAVDAENGIAFFATGNPKPDLVGITRPGTNEGANTLFAVDLNSEQIVWSFQETQHDVWDYDIATPPVLANIKTSGSSELQLVISVTKTGNVFMFDRQTGASLHDIEWKTVDTKTNIPGEYLSPVQIDSSLPERLIRIEYKKDDYRQGSPEEVREISDFLADANLGFYPPHLIGKTTVVYGLHGGANWTGSSLNERTGLLFTPVNQTPWKLRVDATTNTTFESLSAEFTGKWASDYQVYEASCGICHTENRVGVNQRQREKEVTYRPSLVGVALWVYTDASEFKSAVLASHSESNFDGVDLPRVFKFFRSWDEELDRLNAVGFSGGWSYFLTSEGNLATDLPYGKVVATNILTGAIEWESFPGETILFNSTRNGKSLFGGVAASDDGLLYVTGTDDNQLFVLDQSSGAILERHNLPAAGSTPPTLLSIDGRTSVAILATGGKFYNYSKRGASLLLFQH